MYNIAFSKIGHVFMKSGGEERERERERDRERDGAQHVFSKFTRIYLHIYIYVHI